jgi:hypothetical protein
VRPFTDLHTRLIESLPVRVSGIALGTAGTSFSMADMISKSCICLNSWTRPAFFDQFERKAHSLRGSIPGSSLEASSQSPTPAFVRLLSVADVSMSLQSRLASTSRFYPQGTLEAIRVWFRDYKTPDGKPQNEFGFDDKPQSAVSRCIYSTFAFLSITCGTIFALRLLQRMTNLTKGSSTSCTNAL